MKVWEDQFNDLQDQVIPFCEDWPALEDMVAEMPTTREGRDYLDFLVPRLKSMYRIFNWVEFKDGVYRIHNYSWKVFQWFNRKNFKAGSITTRTLFIPADELTSEECEQLRANIYQF